LREQNDGLQATLTKLSARESERDKELADLRNRTNKSQQNWTRERDELSRSESMLREEYESAKQAMQDWEVVAIDERSIRDSLAEKVADLEEQLGTVKAAYEKSLEERTVQAEAVDGLQRTIRDIQEGEYLEVVI
jgi:chromosome segregation ATPase